MSFSLIFHNILFLLGALISIGTAFFVFFSTQRSRSVTTLTFALSCVAVSIFQVSHLLGINASDAETSRMLLMFNLADIFIGMFMTHWFLGFIGKIHQQRYALYAVYASGLSIFTFFMFYPRMFLIESVPKLYLPFYYEPGPLYVLMLGWFMAVSVYHFYQLIQAYRLEKDSIQKNRYKYVLLAMSYAYAFGTTAFMLVFDLPLNPALSALFGLYPLLIVYAILQFEVFDIRIFAKRAFVYGVTIMMVGAAITLTDFLSAYFVTIQPAVPRSFIPIIASVLFGSAGLYVWRKTQDADLAKYEFITIVTHKFRTPLTRIKWATEEMVRTLPDDKKEMSSIVEQSTSQLFELTNILVRLSDSDANTLDQTRISSSVSDLLQQLQSEYASPMLQKQLNFNVKYPEGVAYALINQQQVRLVLQILLDNAISYSPKNGTITLSAQVVREDMQCILSVQDQGIGISKSTARHIFNRFYRGDRARLADTEGMGIGLYMARKLIARQEGKIWVKSPGEDLGSTFYVSIPLDGSKYV
ncbi:MAG: ATP-binding protein [Patescibacteria group bacterium]